MNELAGAAGGGHIGGPGRGKAALGGGCTGPRSRGVRARGCSAGLLEPGPTPSASPTASGSGWAMGSLLWCPPGSPQATRQPLNSASVPPSLELGVRHLEAESCPSQAWTCGPAEGAGHWELGLGEQEERPASSAARLGARGRSGRHVGGSLHARSAPTTGVNVLGTPAAQHVSAPRPLSRRRALRTGCNGLVSVCPAGSGVGEQGRGKPGVWGHLVVVTLASAGPVAMSLCPWELFWAQPLLPQGETCGCPHAGPCSLGLVVTSLWWAPHAPPSGEPALDLVGRL